MPGIPTKQPKVRVRKSAPTIKERAEAKKSDNLSKTMGRRLRVVKKVTVVLGFAKPLFKPVTKLLRFLTPSYFSNAWKEVRQVTWTNRRETWRLTLAVFIFATVFGLVVAVVDKGLDEFFKKVVLK